MRTLLAWLLVLLLLYAGACGTLVYSELERVNALKEELGEEPQSIVAYLAANAARILASPWKVLSELREENHRLSKQLFDRKLEKNRKILEKVAEARTEKTSSSETGGVTHIQSSRRVEVQGEPEPNLTLLRSYSELLSALEEKLSRWDFRGELSITNFNGSSLANLSEEEHTERALMRKIKEQEERINELARQTGRRRIDYGGVEINRFEGDRYFVFLKKEFPEVTVAWRPQVLVNITEAYKIIKETKNAYSEIMGMDDTVSYITVYLWDTRGNYHSAHKYWKSFIPGSGHAKSYNERIVAHVAPREPYSFSSRDFEALSHEFVHALDVYYWERPLPSLETLMEGFADYISKYQVFKREPKISSLNFTKATYLHYECNRGSKTCGKDYWKAYDYSYWFVKFLIENYGVEKFREIYKISDHNDYSYGWKYIDQKFQKVYGKSSGELDREMKAWAEGRD